MNGDWKEIEFNMPMHCPSWLVLTRYWLNKSLLWQPGLWSRQHLSIPLLSSFLFWFFLPLSLFFFFFFLFFFFSFYCSFRSSLACPNWLARQGVQWNLSIANHLCYRGVGCIFFEMASGRPLFPGSTVEDQLQLIFSLLGNSFPIWPLCRSLLHVTRSRTEQKKKPTTTTKRTFLIFFPKFISGFFLVLSQ